MEVTLVTGATGLVGNAIVRALAARGRTIRAFVRDPGRARTLLPEGCALVTGDVTRVEDVIAATDGCDVVYHAAGIPEQWRRDPQDFRRVNVGGTRNVVEAAHRCGVRRLVYTSTIDVFRFEPRVEFDESAIDTLPKHTHYERSKQEADAVVSQACAAGLPAVFLHPSGVYGPGPTSSPGLTRAIAQIARGEVPLLPPGGVPVVYVDDVGRGHVRAEENAEVGERFILHESNHTLVDFARTVCAIAGSGKVPATLPLWCARVFATASEAFARVLGSPPIIARGQVEFLQLDARPLARRARERLGWQPTPFREGVAQTIAWLRETGAL